MPTTEAMPLRRGVMLVLSSPSGAGKTTLSRRLIAQLAGVSLSISVTTRPRRPGEIDGKDYHFVDLATFQQFIREGRLLEHAEVFGHHYGTLAEQVEAELRCGQDVLFDIDWQGTRQLAQARPGDLVSVFVLPPSMQELERRLYQRGQDAPEIIAARMQQAAQEISHWIEYDYVIVNEDLELAVLKVAHILEAERLRRQRQAHLPELVTALCAPAAQTAPGLTDRAVK